MTISGNRQMELIKKLCFVRMAGTPEEKSAADILMETLAEIGVEGHLEPFEIKNPVIKQASFSVESPFQRTVEVKGVAFSGSTADGPLTADFVYVQSAEDLDLIDAKGKIVLTQTYSTQTYPRMVKAGVAGVCFLNGSYFDKNSETDLDVYMLRDAHLKDGAVPSVTMRAKDALALVRDGASRVSMTVEQEETTCQSQNVIAEIKGTRYPEEIIAFTAHYDSVRYSPGAYDNASGAAGIMEILRYYADNPPARTLRFIWFGAEERGLVGSKAYIEAHQDELEQIKLVINIDMIGPILGKEMAFVAADQSLCTMLEYLSKEVGFSIANKQDVYSSDSTAFADKGVPALTFARMSVTGSGEIHNRKDIAEVLSPDALQRSVEFIVRFSDRMIASVCFPVPRKIPDNLVQDLNKYFDREDPASKPESK